MNLYKRKKFKKNKYKFLAIVRSRNCSDYPKEALEKIISEISYNKSIIIISGLALGLDVLSQKLALKYNLKTIAIPGSGLSENVLYPKTNISVASEILKNNGILLSEFEDNFLATKWSFPKRNRIIAALADVILIVEAAEKSGTLITARLSLDYNKNLSVIPNSIFSQYLKGSNMLLKQGASPIFYGNDILELLGEKTDLEKTKQAQIDFSDFSKKEKLILNLLKEPLDKNILREKSNLDITELNIILPTLQIKNIIKESLGKFRIK